MAGIDKAKAANDDVQKRSAWEFATAGTYADHALPTPMKIAFLLVAAAILVIPLVGMSWARTDVTYESRELAEMPEVKNGDGSLNIGFLADAGAYFEDRFAYRNEIVTANSGLRALFATSSTDQVVIGKDGWLYYGGTLPDYLGQSAMTDRALNNVAHNVGLIERYVESHGARFLFTIAPNKNTLYPEHMPYYYLASSSASNATRLKERLGREGIEYLDLFEVFNSFDADDRAEETWYLKRDTHWNNAGALIAASAIVNALGRDFHGPAFADGAKREDFTGDLESILFPASPGVEENWYYEGYDDGDGFSGSLWSYARGENVTDAEVVTRSEITESESTLLMFRDSFGNALIPFLAAEFNQAMFSKLVPYNVALLAAEDRDVVVIERAERHVPDLATSAPLMPSPVISARSLPQLSEQVDPHGAQTSLRIAKDGPYAVLSGEVDPRLAREDSRIFIEFESADGTCKLYDAFWLSGSIEPGANDDFGFQVNMPIGKKGLAEVFAGALVRVHLLSGGDATLAAEFRGDALAAEGGL